MQKKECLKESTEVNASEKVHRRTYGRKSVQEARKELQQDTLLGEIKYRKKYVLKKK